VSDIGLEELAARLGELALLDVRSPAEYDGSRGAPCDPRQGHIPGARNVSLDVIAAADEDELRALVALPAGAEVVAYCHSGARSAQAVAILARCGFEARNYVGSWHEWSRTSLAAESGGELGGAG
jgi:thiosulfate/3-mercaptopyruvate sulfurtransferase